jgi:PhzF family phenazine biosynthesis protein
MRPVAVWVDAFTEAPFAGNPAVVVLLAEPSDEGWMQSLARELGVSETAFVTPRPCDGGAFGLRWFTPAVEVDLCGHATLASAHALWQEEWVPAGAPIRFHTRSGVLSAARREPWIELDFPAAATQAEPAPPGLVEALGAAPVWTGWAGTGDWLVELADEDAVRALAPDLGRLAALPARGVMVTARGRAGAEHDFVSRFFAPAFGVDEDPVTGSAHCALAPYWAARLGKSVMTGWQASPRGGAVRVEVAGDRVRLGGRAVTVLRGELAAT